METEKNSSKFSHVHTCEICMKLPSLNDYVLECRRNKYSASKMKKRIEDDIGWFIKRLPRFKKPVKIHFHWVEKNARRDLDNVAFAKKFILDSMVKHGKLIDDSRRYVKGFTDSFETANEYKVVLFIEEQL